MIDFRIPEYLFIIDTEQYAGDFERRLTAYCTGHVGECGIGGTEAYLYKKEESPVPIYCVSFYPDEGGCLRPCSIWATPNWFNNGLGGHFKDGQEKEAEKHFNEEASTYNRLDLVYSGEKHPAYLSCAIFMHDEPPQPEIRIIKERAIKFADFNNIIITGFRLIKQELLIEEVALQ